MIIVRGRLVATNEAGMKIERDIARIAPELEPVLHFVAVSGKTLT